MTLAIFSRDIVPIVGLFSILLVVWQLRRTNKWNQYNFTYGILASGQIYELENKVIEEFKKKQIDIVTLNEIDDGVLGVIKLDQNLNNAICEYLNFLESFCIGIKHGAVEKNVAFDAVSEKVVRQWVRYKIYIDWFREDGADLYSELEVWALKWKPKVQL